MIDNSITSLIEQEEIKKTQQMVLDLDLRILADLSAIKRQGSSDEQKSNQRNNNI